METTWKTYPPKPFTLLGRIEPSLRLAQIRLAILTFDGGRVALKVTDSLARVVEKRTLGILDVPAGCHAISLYDRRASGQNICEIVVGTEGIDANSALEPMLAGVGMLLNREGRTNLVCGTTPDTHCYARVKRQGVPSPWVNLTELIDAAEIAYVPGARVYIVRKHAGHSLGFLPIEMVDEGLFAARYWNFVSVPGAGTVTGIPPRMLTSRAAMIHILTDEGTPATVAYNLEQISVGRVDAEVDACSRTSDRLRFRGFVDGDTAMVEVIGEFQAGGLEPGVSLVPAGALNEIFGDAAHRMNTAYVMA